MFFHRSTKV